MTAPERPPLPIRLLLLRGLAAILLSLGANWLVLWSVWGFEIVEPFGPLTTPPVLGLTALGAIAATAVYGAVTRIWPWPDRLFIRLAGIVLLASFFPDLALLRFDPEATAGAVVVLMWMHVMVAASCVWMLTDRYSPISR